MFAAWPRLDHPLLKFVLFPLLLALPPFRLHQYIVFGEYYTFGLAAWLSGLLVWWGAWSLGVMLFAAVLRVAVEATHLALLPWPARARAARRIAAMLGRVVYYGGVPVWLAIRLFAG